MDKNKTKKHVEILAPAGSYEAMTAAALGGCDAVYAAGMRYGARAYAKNFTTEELCRSIDYLHLRGKKLYVTMNTLIKEDEMNDELFNTIRLLYEEGLDAVIVQDVGLMKLIHENFPKLPIHASTQTSLMSVYGARLLKKTGVRRIIPARECSLSDIKQLCEGTDLEIECFVHGALCFCYSGQCLFSSMNGGRSGNRGRCAQPCRLPYSLDNGKCQYLLSPKDMCTLNILPDLIEAGIDSFKIEGRMKRNEYCTLTSFLYKKYSEAYYEHGREYYFGSFIDEKGARHKEFINDLRDLMDIFNRGGFSTGYYKNGNGKEMMSMERPNHFGSLVGTVTNCHFEDKSKKNKADTKNTKNSFKITIMPDSDIRKDDVLEIRDNGENTVHILNGSADFKAGYRADFLPYGLSKADRERIRALLEREGSLKLYRLRNHSLLNRLNEDFFKESIRNKITPFKKDYPFLLGEPVKAYLSGRVGEPLSLSLEGRQRAFVSDNQPLSAAKNEGFSEDRLRENINKTGEFPFLIELNTDGLDKDCFIPMSLFNRLRREAMEELKEKTEKSYKRSYSGDFLKEPEEIISFPAKPLISCSVITREQAEKVLELAESFPDRKFVLIINGAVCSIENALEILRGLADIRKEEGFPEIFLSMPYIFSPRVQKIWERGFLTEEDLLKELSGVYVRTIDEAGYMREKFPDIPIGSEQGMYLWNKWAGEFYRENGISFYTLSPEQCADDLKGLDLSNSCLPVYGNVCLMASAQCLIKNSAGCTGKSGFYHFKDREGKAFMGINVCPYCYNLIFSASRETPFTDTELTNVCNIRFDFYREGAGEISEIITKHLKGKGQHG